MDRYDEESYIINTLSEAIGSLGCRRTRTSGSVLIRQLTELQLMTFQSQWNQLAFQLIQLDIPGFYCPNADDIHLSEQKITLVSCI